MELAPDPSQHKKRRNHAKIFVGVLIAVILPVIAFFWPYLWTTPFRSEVGVALPPSATDFHSAKQYGWDGNEYWASAKISPEDFAKLAGALNATRDSEKLNYWAGKAFRSQSSPDISAWWCKNTALNEDTFIAVGFQREYILLKYENGRFFLNHSSF